MPEEIEEEAVEPVKPVEQKPRPVGKQETPDIEDDMNGERVKAVEPDEYEEPVVVDESGIPMDKSGEAVESVEPEKTPDPDAAGEAVPNNEPGPAEDRTGEKVKPVEPGLEPDLEGEKVDSEENMADDDKPGEEVESEEKVEDVPDEDMPEEAVEPHERVRDEEPVADLSAVREPERNNENPVVQEEKDIPEDDYIEEIVVPVEPDESEPAPDEDQPGEKVDDRKPEIPKELENDGEDEGVDSTEPEEEAKPEEEYKPIILEKEEEPVEEVEQPEIPLTGIFKNESDLVSGKYYVQFATVIEAREAEELARKHSQYPVVAIPGAGGKGFRVLVGPLGLDEYGAVLEKFRDAGYRDAFTRKIK